jgi:hypothetical protein
MAEPDEHGLRRLVEEGTRSARQPPLADLRRRARRRRAFREVATVTAVAAAVLAVVPLVAAERSTTGPPGPTASRTPRPTPTVTGPSESLVATPSETVPGGTITLTGTGSAPGGTVSFGIHWERGAKLSLSMDDLKKSPGKPRTTATAAGTHQLASAGAHADGSFTATVTIPADPVVNRPTLWARCQSPASARQLAQYVSILVRNR